jgi:hypothetical protein
MGAVQDDERAGLLDSNDSNRVLDSDSDITFTTGSINQYKVSTFLSLSLSL